MSEITQTAMTTETKKNKGKATKKAAKPKAKAAKVAKPKKEKAPKEKKPKVPREDRSDWQTFALRLPKGESASLHAAAGPANASRVVRSLIAAFVAEDGVSFEAVVEDAKKLR